MLDELVPVGGALGDECASLEVLVDAQACPGVDGGIALLGFGELWGFPVGELLSLADLVLEEDGVDLLQAHVADAVLLDEVLELDEAGWMDVGDAGQLVKVVGGGESDLGDAVVLEELLEWGGDAGLVQAEQEGMVVGSQLQQGDVVALAAVEAGPGLGIESAIAEGAQGALLTCEMALMTWMRPGKLTGGIWLTTCLSMDTTCMMGAKVVLLADCCKWCADLLVGYMRSTCLTPLTLRIFLVRSSSRVMLLTLTVSTPSNRPPWDWMLMLRSRQLSVLLMTEVMDATMPMSSRPSTLSEATNWLPAFPVQRVRMMR